MVTECGWLHMVWTHSVCVSLVPRSVTVLTCWQEYNQSSVHVGVPPLSSSGCLSCYWILNLSLFFSSLHTQCSFGWEHQRDLIECKMRGCTGGIFLKARSHPQRPLLRCFERCGFPSHMWLALIKIPPEPRWLHARQRVESNVKVFVSRNDCFFPQAGSSSTLSRSQSQENISGRE